MTNLDIHRDKTKTWLSQKQRVFEALRQRPQTRLQVSKNTGTPLQNICRYIADFRKDQRVFIVKIDRCPISEMKAEFISTDPRYAPDAQLKMF